MDVHHFLSPCPQIPLPQWFSHVRDLSSYSMENEYFYLSPVYFCGIIRPNADWLSLPDSLQVHQTQNTQYIQTSTQFASLFASLSCLISTIIFPNQRCEILPFPSLHTCVQAIRKHCQDSTSLILMDTFQPMSSFFACCHISRSDLFICLLNYGMASCIPCL